MSAAKLLTKTRKVSNEQKRISRLTHEHDSHFKLIFSHQLEGGYTFNSLHKKSVKEGLKKTDVLRVLREFSKFVDATVKLSISEVEATYKRTSDVNDATWDPETKTDVQVEHRCLYSSDEDAKGAPDNVRLHGYFRNNGGYFIVTRLDWFHKYHKK